MSKIISYILFICVFSLNAFGQNDSTFLERQKRDTAVFHEPIPKFDSLDTGQSFRLSPISWTNDFEHILTQAEIDILDSIIEQFEKKTTIEIAIITVDSFFSTKKNFDNDITALRNNWGVGKKEKNNGIIIGISSSLRKTRISNGIGIESRLSDAETKKIIDEVMIPEFKQANFFEGIQKGLLSLIRKLE